MCWAVCGEWEMMGGGKKASTLQKLIAMVFGVALIVAIAAIVFVILVPTEGEHYTEFYILGEDGVAAGYPELIRIGEPETVIIGVNNQEHRSVDYRIEVYLLNETNDLNESIINTMVPLDQFEVTLSHDQNEEWVYSFNVNEIGYNRVVFLLFNERVPPEEVVGVDRINASYRDLYLLIRME